MVSKSTLAIIVAAVAVLAVAACAIVMLNGGEKTVDHLEDGSAGIAVDGGSFPSGTALSSSIVTGQERSDALSALPDGAVDESAAVVYDISAVKNGSAVQPKGAVKVSVPPVSGDAVAYLVSGGSAKALECAVSDGKARFGTDSLGRFVVGAAPVMRTIAVTCENAVVSVNGAAPAASFTGSFRDGSTVSLSATPAQGYMVEGYEIGGKLLAGSSISHVVDSDAAIKVVAKEACKITVTATDATVTVDGNSVATPYQGLVAKGSSVVLKAVPDEGFSFGSWTVNGEKYAGSEITVRNVTADIAVSAAAVPAPMRTLTVSIEHGSVSVDGKDLGASGSVQVRENKRTVLEADLDYGYRLKGWQVGGAYVSTSNPYEAVLRADTHVVAVVESTLRTVTVQCPGGGIIIESTNVGPEYRTMLYEGETLTVNAVPARGNTFSSWDINGKTYGAEYQSVKIEMGRDDILAVAKTVPLEDSTIHVTATNGSIVVGGVDTGAAFYEAKASLDQVIELEAIPDNGYRLVSWIVDGKTFDGQILKITMGSEHVNVSAVMEKNGTHRLVASIINGVIYVDGKLAGTSVDRSVEDGSVVTLSAVPDEGYALAGWLSDGDYIDFATERKILMDGDVSLIVKTVPQTQ